MKSRWLVGGLIAVAVLSGLAGLGMTRRARAQAPVQHEGYAALWHEFTPANDVAFVIDPTQSSVHVGDPITLRYDLINVSNRALFAPKPWAVCPPQKHVLAWLEDSAGRHVFGGFGYSCPTNFPTIAERMGKEAQLLKPGDRLSNTVSVDMKTVAVDTKLLAPGDYRVEATFYGWKPEDFSDADVAELAKMGAPFLRGEVPASAKVTLTPALPLQTAETSLSGGHDEALVHVASTLSSSEPIVKTTPTLPAAAKRAGVIGPVVLEITVDRSGNVTVGRVLHGDPLLNAAAEDAVRQWKYQPVLVAGRPASVVLSVSVAFKDR
jgi:TonB family protein